MQALTIPADCDPALAIGPQPGGQTIAMSSHVFEVFFGGVAGPGKTWFLAIDALGLQFKTTSLGKAAIEVPEYRAILFRRTSTELGKILDEAHRYYPLLGGIYAARRHGEPGATYEFPRWGSKIYFCHLQNEQDKHNHQTFEYQYVAFDELPQFTLTQYLYLFSRCRSKIPHLFARVRSAGNPVGPGLVWVRKRFIANQTPYIPAYFLGDRDPVVNPQGIRVQKDTPDALGRVFIPGVLAENRYADPMYPSYIKAMGSIMERALLKGDWEAFGGDFFPTFDRTTMVIPPFGIPAQWYLYGSLDPGWASPCSFSLRAVDFKNNHYRIATYYERERSAPAHAKAIKTFIKECKYTAGRMPQMIVAGKDAWAKQDRYAIIASQKTFADEFEAEGLTLQPANTDRIQGWWAIRNLMEAGRWFVFGWNPAPKHQSAYAFEKGNDAEYFISLNRPFLEELVSATRDEHQPEDIKGRGYDPEVIDHALDEERYGVIATYKPTPPKSEESWAQAFAKKSKAAKPWKPGMG